MQGSKIRLSPAEAALFCDAEVILTKNSIVQKTVALLSSVQEEMVKTAPAWVSQTSPPPKISKGENYCGLPYVVLDYPRLSSGEDLLFVRSFFWWGNFYSSTLQFAGQSRLRHMEKLLTAQPALSENDYFIGVNTDPWVHHFGPDNYQPIRGMSTDAFAALLNKLPHLKLAKKWPLEHWEEAEENLVESWRLLIGLIA